MGSCVPTKPRDRVQRQRHEQITLKDIVCIQIPQPWDDLLSWCNITCQCQQFAWCEVSTEFHYFIHDSVHDFEFNRRSVLELRPSEVQLKIDVDQDNGVDAIIGK